MSEGRKAEGVPANQAEPIDNSLLLADATPPIPVRPAAKPVETRPDTAKPGTQGLIRPGQTLEESTGWVEPAKPAPGQWRAGGNNVTGPALRAAQPGQAAPETQTTPANANKPSEAGRTFQTAPEGQDPGTSTGNTGAGDQAPAPGAKPRDWKTEQVTNPAQRNPQLPHPLMERKLSESMPHITEQQWQIVNDTLPPRSSVYGALVPGAGVGAAMNAFTWLNDGQVSNRMKDNKPVTGWLKNWDERFSPLTARINLEQQKFLDMQSAHAVETSVAQAATDKKTISAQRLDEIADTLTEQLKGHSGDLTYSRVLKSQQDFLKEMDNITDPAKLKAVIGSADEVAAGTKLFVEGSDELKTVRAMAGHLTDTPDPSATAAFQRLRGAVDSELAACNKAISEAGAVRLLQAQEEFLLHPRTKNDIHKINQAIGTADEVAAYSKYLDDAAAGARVATAPPAKLFVAGSDEVKALTQFAEDSRSAMLAAKLEKDALTNMDNAEAALKVARDRVRDSLAGTVFQGGARGLRVAGLTLTAGYAADMAVSSVLGTEQPSTNAWGRAVLDGVVLPTVLMAKTSGDGHLFSGRTKFLAAATVFGLSRYQNFSAGESFTGGSYDMNRIMRINGTDTALVAGAFTAPGLSPAQRWKYAAGGYAIGRAANVLDLVEQNKSYRESVFRADGILPVGLAASTLLPGKYKLAGAAGSYGLNILANSQVGSLDTRAGAVLGVNGFNTVAPLLTVVAAKKLDLPKKVVAGALVAELGAGMLYGNYQYNNGIEARYADDQRDDALRAFNNDQKNPTSASFDSAVQDFKDLALLKPGEGAVKAYQCDWINKEGTAKSYGIAQAADTGKSDGKRASYPAYLRGAAVLGLALGETNLEKGSRPVTYDYNSEKDAAEKVYGKDSRILPEHKIDIFGEATTELRRAGQALVTLEAYIAGHKDQVIDGQKMDDNYLEQIREQRKRVEDNLAVIYGQHDMNKVFDEVKQAFRTRYDDMHHMTVNLGRAYDNMQVKDPQAMAKYSRDLAVLKIAYAEYGADQGNGDASVQVLKDIDKYMAKAVELDPNNPNLAVIRDRYVAVSAKAKQAQSRQYQDPRNNPLNSK